MEEHQKYLLTQLVTTSDFVAYLRFLDEIQLIIEDMENELEYCKELYDIMEEYEVAIPSEDMSNYLGLSVDMGSFRSLIDKKVEKKSKLIKIFNNVLGKDISAMIADIGNIKDECLVRYLSFYFVLSKTDYEF